MWERVWRSRLRCSLGPEEESGNMPYTIFTVVLVHKADPAPGGLIPTKSRPGGNDGRCVAFLYDPVVRLD